MIKSDTYQPSFIPVTALETIPHETIAIDNGSIIESEFILKCQSLGLRVSKPISNSYPYDYIIDNKRQLLKIQVKGSQIGAVTTGRGNSKSYYQEGDFDYLVAKMHQSWFVIPFDIVQHRKKIKIGLSLIQKYREKWSHLIE